MTAEVVKVDASGYVSLSVCECEILSNIHGLKLKPLEKGEVIRKQRSTIGKGNGERLKWSREDARSLIVSIVGRFMPGFQGVWASRRVRESVDQGPFIVYYLNVYSRLNRSRCHAENSR